jgi:hypothetical protein
MTTNSDQFIEKNASKNYFIVSQVLHQRKKLLLLCADFKTKFEVVVTETAMFRMMKGLLKKPYIV